MVRQARIRNADHNPERERSGDVIGHEFIGQVVEVGRGVEKVKKGDRVLIASFGACGNCWYCRHELFSLCDNTNPNAELQAPLLGYPTGACFGYTHAFGGYAGSHAQYTRAPPADVGCFTIPDGLPDEQVLFLSDAAPTGYMGADFCGIQPGTPSPRAVPGCGSPRWKSAAGAKHALSCTGSAWVPGIGHQGPRQPGVAMGLLAGRRGPRGRDPRGPV